MSQVVPHTHNMSGGNQDLIERLRKAEERAQRAEREREIAEAEREREKREREFAEDRATRAENANARADIKPRSLWDRLKDFKIINEISYEGTIKYGTSQYSTKTTRFAKPVQVGEWTFNVQKPVNDIETTTSLPGLDFVTELDGIFKLFQASEEDACSNIILPLLQKAVGQARRFLNDQNIQIFLKYKLNLLDASIPDYTITVKEGDNKEITIMHIEAKSPSKYPLVDEKMQGISDLTTFRIPRPPTNSRGRKPIQRMIVHNANLCDYYIQYESTRFKNNSPISQIYNYGCVDEIKYLILSTGIYTWFLLREKSETQPGNILKMSKCFNAQDKNPSLIQAFVTFILMAVNERSITVPLSEYEKSKIIKLRNADNGGVFRKLRNSIGKTNKRNSNTRNSQGKMVNVELPLDSIEFNLEPLESYSPRFGVAHRLSVNELDAVVKIMEGTKNREGAEELQNEAEIYTKLSDLCGDAIPNMIYSGRLENGNRPILAVSYEGTSLEDNYDMVSPITYQKAKHALEKIHEKGVAHGDIALRNIVINDNGDVKLIDFGHAYKLKRKEAQSIKVSELEQLQSIFSFNI